MCRYMIYTFEACGHQEAIGTQDCGTSTSHTCTTDDLGDPGYSCTLCNNLCTFTNKRQDSLDAQTKMSGTRPSEVGSSNSSGDYIGIRRRASSDASLSGASDSDSISSLTLSVLGLEARECVQSTHLHPVNKSIPRSHTDSELDTESRCGDDHKSSWFSDIWTGSPPHRLRPVAHSVPSSDLSALNPYLISAYIHVDEVDAPNLKKWIVKKLNTVAWSSNVKPPDTDTLADYILALVKPGGPEGQVRYSCMSNLSTYLQNHTVRFVNEVLDTIRNKSFLHEHVDPDKSYGVEKIDGHSEGSDVSPSRSMPSRPYSSLFNPQSWALNYHMEPDFQHAREIMFPTVKMDQISTHNAPIQASIPTVSYFHVGPSHDTTCEQLFALQTQQVLQQAQAQPNNSSHHQHSPSVGQYVPYHSLQSPYPPYSFYPQYPQYPQYQPYQPYQLYQPHPPRPPHNYDMERLLQPIALDDAGMVLVQDSLVAKVVPQHNLALANASIHAQAHSPYNIPAHSQIRQHSVLCVPHSATPLGDTPRSRYRAV